MLPKYAMGIKIQVCRMLAGICLEMHILLTHGYNKADKYDELDTIHQHVLAILIPVGSEVVRAS